jgi:hypothetical protein
MMRALRKTAVHRAGMHDQRVGLGQRQLLRIEAEEMEVLAHRGHETSVHALPLQAEHHDDIGTDKPLPHVGEDFDTETLDPVGEQCGRADDADPGAQRIQEQDVGSGNAAMGDVAADRYYKPGDVAFVAADSERVEERLGRMLVAAVAGVDDRARDLLRQQFYRAGRMVTHDENIRAHGVQRHRRVDQGFALLQGGIADGHIHDVGAEALAGKLE